MSRQHHRAVSDSDIAREELQFNSETDILGIIHNFQAGLTSPLIAAKRLERTNSVGVLRAGEILLEHAFRVDDEDEAIDLFHSSRLLFERAERTSRITDSSDTNLIAARAKIHNLHIPLHALLALTNQIPPAKLAEKTYQETIDVAYGLARGLDKLIDPYTHYNRQIIGFVAELAIWGLLFRAPLINTGLDSTVTLFAHMSEDKRNRKGSTINRGWDLSEFSQPEDDAAYLRAKIQVKNKDPNGHGPQNPYEEGITLISVDPDIRLGLSETRLATRTIEECYSELHSINGSAVATINLDSRTEMLSPKLDFI